mgnify:CR=1 FL=1
MNFFIQGIGIIGMAMCVLCFHSRRQKNVLLIKLGADIAWTTHYFLLGAFAGGATNAICCIRECVYLIEKNEKRRYVWLALFIALNWICAAARWKGIESMIPAFVSTLGAYSFWQKNIKVTRGLGIINGILMFTYDIFAKSYIGMISESFTILSASLALLRTKKNLNI